MKKVVVVLAVIAASIAASAAHAGSRVTPKLGPRTCVPDPSGAPVIRCY